MPLILAVWKGSSGVDSSQDMHYAEFAEDEVFFLSDFLVVVARDWGDDELYFYFPLGLLT
jgi:hypothetical protein